MTAFPYLQNSAQLPETVNSEPILAESKLKRSERRVSIGAKRRKDRK